MPASTYEVMRKLSMHTGTYLPMYLGTLGMLEMLLWRWCFTQVHILYLTCQPVNQRIYSAEYSYLGHATQSFMLRQWCHRASGA